VFRIDRDISKTQFAIGGGVIVAVRCNSRCLSIGLLIKDSLLDQVAGLIIGESETLQIVVSYIPHNGSYKLYKVHLENITDIYNNLQDHQHICVLGDLSLIFNHPSFGLRIRSITLHCQATYINQTRFFSPMIFSVWA